MPFPISDFGLQISDFPNPKFEIRNPFVAQPAGMAVDVLEEPVYALQACLGFRIQAGHGEIEGLGSRRGISTSS